ncbi:MAG: hypothetical protein COA78_03490 [Blastopirellula sp.]|nr:MAG: hypothetical protein COA78_03490 [Blastopirellula sp.]
MRKHQVLSLLTVLLVVPCSFLIAESAEKVPRVEIVLFTPSDIEPPVDAELRLKQLGSFTEQFFVKWLKKAGYPPVREQFFTRDDMNEIVVRRIKGDKTAASGAYDKWGFARSVRLKTEEQYSLPDHGNMYWIFVWLGEDREYKDWRGLGTPKGGGVCMVRYPKVPDPLVTKTYIHELGHVFSLPHIGPLKKQREDVSLMGPNLINYRKLIKKPYRTYYMTPAASAMIWKHPVFTGTVEQRGSMPKQLELSAYQAKFDLRKKEITITGKIRSDMPCHSVVLVDQSQGAPGPYWYKSYVSRVASDGSFKITVSEPIPRSGIFKLLPCFENGINTGNKTTNGLQSAISKPYTWNGKKFIFR